MKNRIISLVLALSLLLSCLSLNVFAAETSTDSEGTQAQATTTPAHTDAEIEKFIQDINYLQASIGEYLYNKTPTTSPSVSGVNAAGKITVEQTADGGYRYVYGAPVSADKTSSNSYVNHTEHATYSSRNLVTGYDGYKAKGQSFVIQLDTEFADKVYENTKTDFSIIQLSTYLSNLGRDGINKNALGNIAPHILTFSTTKGTYDEDGNLLTPGTLTLRGRDKGTMRDLMKLSTGVDYTFAIHVDPSVVDAANNIYGVYDVYVNGECVASDLGFFTKSENDAMDFSGKATTPYFVDNSFTSYTNTAGKTAYCLNDEATIDAQNLTAAGKVLAKNAYFFVNEEDLPTGDAFIAAMKACGFSETGTTYTKKDGTTVTVGDQISHFTPVAIGTANGVQDFCLAFVRFFSTTSLTFSGTAFYFDNLMVYYTESGDTEYVDVTEHKYEAKEHTHSYDADATVTYKCIACDASYEVALDSNGDKACDACIGLGGSLTPGEIKSSGVDYRYVSDFNGTESIYISTNGGSTKLHRVQGADGNSYLAYYNPTYAEGYEGEKDTQTSYLQMSIIDTIEPSSGYKNAIVNFEKNKGRSYTVSFDFFLGKGYIDNSAGTNFGYEYDALLQFMCYMTVNKSVAPTKLNVTNFKPFSLCADGTLACRVADVTDMNKSVALKEETWYTIVMHHDPETNTYDAFVNGECIGDNLQALSDEQLKLITWSAVITKDNNGNDLTEWFAERYPDGLTSTPKDFMPNFVRTPQWGNATANTAFGFDNFKVYYTDTNIECTHKWNHAHNSSENELTYTCEYCGKVSETTLPMVEDFSVLTGSGNLMTPEEVNNSGVTVDKSTEINNSETIGTQLGGMNYAGTMEIVTEENGNHYIKYGQTENVYHDSDYLQRITAKGGSRSNVLKNFTEYAGKSYTVAFDFMHYGNRSGSILQVFSYTNKPSGTLTDGVWTAITQTSAVSNTVLSVDNKGTLTYRNAVGSNSMSTATTKLETGKFYNVVFHHTPETNTYDLFINGECIANDAVFLSNTQKNDTTWTATWSAISTKYSEIDPKAKVTRDGQDYFDMNWSDFTVGFVRFPTNQPYTKYTSFKLYDASKAEIENVANVKPKFASVDGGTTIVPLDDVNAKYTVGSDKKVNAIYLYKENKLDLCAFDNIKIYYTETNIECTHVCTTSNKCDLCGTVLEYNACDTCGGHLLDNGVAVSDRFVTLSDEIEMSFLLNVIDGYIEKNPDAEIRITADGRQDVAAKLSELEKTESGKYLITMPLRSIDMTKTVTITLGGEDVYTTSVVDYLRALKKDADTTELGKATLALVDAMLNYGAYAQKYFASIGDATIAQDLANTSLLTYKKSVASVDALALAAHRITVEDTSANITVDGAKLVLSSEIRMKLYVIAPTGFTVTDADGRTYAPMTDKDGTYVLISKANPAELDDLITLTVKAGDEVETVTLNFISVLDAIFESGTSDMLIDLARATYLYHTAADAYVKLLPAA